MPTRSEEASQSQLYVAVFLGGAIGALTRAGILELWPVTPGQWPWATFLANLSGCAILAFVISHQRVNGWSSARLALLGSGFCGALTTFSTIQLELYEMIDLGDIELALIYALTSLSVGFLAVSTARRFVDSGRDLA